jgi:hypothetical protein
VAISRPAALEWGPAAKVGPLFLVNEPTKVRRPGVLCVYLQCCQFTYFGELFMSPLLGFHTESVHLQAIFPHGGPVYLQPCALLYALSPLMLVTSFLLGSILKVMPTACRACS